MLTLAGAGYRYASGAQIGPINLVLRPSECTLLTGPTGCGKSTLIRLAAGLLQRHGQGQVLGRVSLGSPEVDAGALSPRECVSRVGFVAQNPTDQLITGSQEDEIAFALESIGWPEERIRSRVQELVNTLGLVPDLRRSPWALSGGQQQKLVLAAGLAGGAPLVLLDEPLAHLDGAAARDLLEVLAEVVREDGVTVLLVEHRLEWVWSMVDRLVVMEEGCLVCDTTPEAMDLDVLRRLGLRLPGRVDVEARLGRPLAEVRLSAPPAQPEQSSAPTADPIVVAEALCQHYGNVVALDQVSLEACAGESIAILGANGSGKSTLLRALGGASSSGILHVQGRAIGVPQQPDLSLFCGTVREELSYGPREAGLTEHEVGRRVQEVAQPLSLMPLLDKPPQSLSRGQRLRVAVGAVIAVRPQVALLDEPTAGQDWSNVRGMMLAVREQMRDGVLIFATHDVELALAVATRVIVLEAGRVALQGDLVALLPEIAAMRMMYLPPLMQWCVAHQWPPLSADQVVRAAEV